MVNSMVERATNDMLIGPDWATNIQICDIILTDVGQAKDVVRGIKKRLGRSKNPEVQLLTLTLLETIVKNCGDILHGHVAEKDIPHEMVKIARKKPDIRVKEKILILIDTWQETLGGPRARYPQYYAAYQELLRAGVVFPQKSRSSTPVITPPQRQDLGLSNQNLHNPDCHQDAPGSSGESKFISLSLTEIQNAQGIVDVLSEMLNALDPENTEGVGQDVIVDLVDQCISYKQRVVHIMNLTSDESLLGQGLSLNDELERVLSNHEAIAFQKEKLEPELVGACHHGPPVNARDDSKQPEMKSTSNTGSGTQIVHQSLPPATNGSAPPAKFDPQLDLLSGDDYISPLGNTSLALVPLAEQQPTTPVSQQNAIVLFDMFYDNNQATDVADIQSANPGDQTRALVSQSGLHLNGTAPTPTSSHYEQSPYVHAPDPSSSQNGQVSKPEQQQLQPLSPIYGAQSSDSFPPPPWETRPMNDDVSVTRDQYPHSMNMTQVVFTHMQGGEYPQGPQPMGNDQVVGMYIQPIMASQISPLNGQDSLDRHPQTFHEGGTYEEALPRSVQTEQMTAIYPSVQMLVNHFNNHVNSIQPQGAQYVEQRMYGLSIRDDNSVRNSSYHISTSSYVPPSKPSKPKDNLFGDLVDMANFKSKKPTPSSAGSG